MTKKKYPQSRKKVKGFMKSWNLAPTHTQTRIVKNIGKSANKRGHVSKGQTKIITQLRKRR